MTSRTKSLVPFQKVSALNFFCSHHVVNARARSGRSVWTNYSGLPIESIATALRYVRLRGPASENQSADHRKRTWIPVFTGMTKSGPVVSQINTANTNRKSPCRHTGARRFHLIVITHASVATLLSVISHARRDTCVL